MDAAHAQQETRNSFSNERERGRLKPLDDRRRVPELNLSPRSLASANPFPLEMRSFSVSLLVPALKLTIPERLGLVTATRRPMVT